ncbi:MAG TPA: L,D-transpeptidase family protein [Pyrinomonadaceae bacterium]|nr:L,D-transpeptidase family protein [Pyrinomonadaceae bacterium]
MNKRISATSLALALTVLSLSCVTQTPSNTNSVASTSPTPASAAPTPAAVAEAVAVPVTLPVLDALFADDSFKADLKSKLNLTEDQITRLRKAATEEIARLAAGSSEPQEGAAAEARDRAAEAIQSVVGAQQTEALMSLAREHWMKGNETLESGKPAETMLPGPNAVPKDTRIVVNIPAYRMDLFQDGQLIKSYKIGIGYPQFPLPTGLRKAQTIIFNPTWTPPDEPWVAKMKGIAVGEKVSAGSPLNPLGPIKIPIGMPSLIHGGKPLAKIGTFASHGCVGLTNAQVKDFAKNLGTAGGKGISDQTITRYLQNPEKTQVLKLDAAVPVELRYETIVVEDGKLNIYKDVYDQNTNTEENLRLTLAQNGVQFEDLSDAERDQALEALNAMSSRPQKQIPKPSNANASPATSTSNGNENSKVANAKDSKATAARKPISRKQKQVVLEVAALSGKGYPAPVNLDTGTGKPAKKVGTTAVL